MKTFIICNKCGSIQNYSDKFFDSTKKKYIKCECGCTLEMSNTYPLLTTQDFVFSAYDLYDKSKECDKENLESIFQILCKENVNSIDKTKLDLYINSYEKLKAKYPDNDPNYFITVIDEFENFLMSKQDANVVDTLISMITVFNSNKFRKPFIIMTLSLIEQLFNDYFVLIIKSNLSSGADNFLKIYETSGMQNCINILDSFLDEPLKYKMDKYYTGYYDKWASLRKLRNDIIHSNTKYVSKTKCSEIYKFIDISVEMFAKLKSDIYKKINNHKY